MAVVDRSKQESIYALSAKKEWPLWQVSRSRGLTSGESRAGTRGVRPHLIFGPKYFWEIGPPLFQGLDDRLDPALLTVFS